MRDNYDHTARLIVGVIIVIIMAVAMALFG